VRGIGRWTVEMLLMFRLGRPDVLPIDDFGVRNGFRLAYGLRGMPTPRALGEFGARWAPYRSVAAWYLWRAVDLHKAGKLPAPSQQTRIKIVKKKKVVKARKPALKKLKKGRSPKRKCSPVLPHCRLRCPLPGAPNHRRPDKSSLSAGRRTSHAMSRRWSRLRTPARR
jgi:hypothetical protein